MNHLLKLSTDWRPRRLPELNDRLYKVVQQQMADLRRAMYSHGYYTLCDGYKHLVVTHAMWQSMSEDDKVKAFKQFLTAEAKTVINKAPTSTLTPTVSSDGVLSRKTTKHIATKPRQRRRPFPGAPD
jgi:hypothetical protein